MALGISKSIIWSLTETSKAESKGAVRPFRNGRQKEVSQDRANHELLLYLWVQYGEQRMHGTSATFTDTL